MVDEVIKTFVAKARPSAEAQPNSQAEEATQSFTDDSIREVEEIVH